MNKEECQHEYKPVTKDYPILNVPHITNQQLIEYVCKKCGHKSDTVTFTGNMPCASVGVIYDD
jgi:C4-type Zn-finger protein